MKKVGLEQTKGETRNGGAGSPMIFYLNARRKAHRLAGCIWTKTHEENWLAEWHRKSDAEQDEWKGAMLEKRRANALDDLAQLAASADTSSADVEPAESEPPTLPLPRTLLAGLGDDCWPIRKEAVQDFIRTNSSRGGVTKLAQQLRTERAVFADHPPEESLPDAGPPDLRCVDVTPGFCANEHPEAERVKLLSRFLHAQHLQHVREGELEPLIILEPLDNCDQVYDAAGVWLYSHHRKAYPTAAWLRCSWTGNNLGDGRGCAIAFGCDARPFVRTSWDLASSMAMRPGTRWKYSLLQYRLLEMNDLATMGLHWREGMMHMCTLGPKEEDFVLAENLQGMLDELEAVAKTAKAAQRTEIANPFLRDLADLACAQVRRARKVAAAASLSTSAPRLVVAGGDPKKAQGKRAAPSEVSTTAAGGSAAPGSPAASGSHLGSDDTSWVGIAEEPMAEESGSDLDDVSGAQELSRLRLIMAENSLGEAGDVNDGPPPALPPPLPPPAAPAPPPCSRPGSSTDPPPADTPAAPGQNWRFICGDPRILAVTNSMLLHNLARPTDLQPPCRHLNGRTQRFSERPTYGWMRPCPLCFPFGLPDT